MRSVTWGSRSHRGLRTCSPGCSTSRKMSEPHRLVVRVYYEDTDFSGVVYHANYLRYLERGRTELLRACGIAQAAMHDTTTGEPLAFAVRRMTIEFLRPARMDDLLDVETRVGQCGGASLELIQTISRDTETLLRAAVKIALVGSGRARRFPRALVEQLTPA
jgi:acyl-CoA thioester hydrolase